VRFSDLGLSFPETSIEIQIALFNICCDRSYNPNFSVPCQS